MHYGNNVKYLIEANLKNMNRSCPAVHFSQQQLFRPHHLVPQQF